MNDLTLFLHVPKSGGSTLNWILRHQYRRSEYLLVIRHFSSLDAPVDDWRALPDRRRRELRMVSAHMSLGLHQLVDRPAVYITIVREPVSRVISAYYHMRRNPRHPLHEHARDQPLERFVASGVFLDADNGQVRRVSGVGDRVGIGGCGPAELASAQHNIREHFHFVGVTDLFDESLLLLRARLGWSTPGYLYQNRGRNRPPDAHISDAARRVIQQHSELDAELYETARDAVRRAVADLGPGFQAELQRFRTLNRTYFRGVFFPERVRGKVRAERRRRRRARLEAASSSSRV